MGQIVVLPEAQKKLDELLFILTVKYFSYMENAEEYVNNLHDFIETIPHKKYRKTNISKYGAWYCKYKPNNHTTWYFTFDTDGKRFIIRNIFNNHTKDYPRFIKAK